MFVFFFFFSSRRRHTRFDCDWSSDVCSSDLAEIVEVDAVMGQALTQGVQVRAILLGDGIHRLVQFLVADTRSEERRVGKSVDLGGRRIIKKKKKKTR